MVRNTGVQWVDPMSDRPVYKQIADTLREQIDAGVYQPGDKLPSELQLLTRAGVSRETARQAIEVLRLEGRVRSQRGRGVFVQEKIRPVVTHNSRRLRREYRQRGMAPREVDEALGSVQLAFDVWELAEVPAPAEVAELLGVPPGQAVFVRRRTVSYRNGPPIQRADSYLPLDIAVGLIRDKDSGPGGTYQRIEENGHHLTRFTERLTFRMPAQGEKHALQLDDGVPVIDFVRVAYAGEHPVEAFFAVMAGDRNRFEYVIEADL